VIEKPFRANVFDRNCPSRLILAALADKWSLLTIDALSSGPIRTGELRRRIDGISQKMLTETLRKLEGMGLVHRKARQTIPPHVEYSLTEQGRELCKLVNRIDRWVEEHLSEMTCRH